MEDVSQTSGSSAERYRRAKERALANPLEWDDPRHGTVGAYSNWKCRCERCTEAWLANERRLKHNRIKRSQVKKAKLNLKHGMPWTYSNWRCRCEACRMAWRFYDKAKSASDERPVQWRKYLPENWDEIVAKSDPSKTTKIRPPAHKVHKKWNPWVERRWRKEEGGG